MSKHKLDKTLRVTRAFELADIRAAEIGEEGTFIEGHAAVYGQKTNIGGWFNEIIERGAFDQTNFDDVLFSTNHDMRKIPLARSRRNNGKSTMKLNVDDIGLYMRADLDVEGNPEAKSLHSSVKRGDIDGMSFIFFVEEEKWEELDSDMPTRRILKIKRVIEVSAVNFPAYEGTDINARDTLDSAKMALDNARSTGLDNPNEVEKLKLRAQILAKGQV